MIKQKKKWIPYFDCTDDLLFTKKQSCDLHIHPAKDLKKRREMGNMNENQCICGHCAIHIYPSCEDVEKNPFFHRCEHGLQSEGKGIEIFSRLVEEVARENFLKNIAGIGVLTRMRWKNP